VIYDSGSVIEQGILSPRERMWLMKKTLRPTNPESITTVDWISQVLHVPLSSEDGTYKTVKAKSWPWLSGKGLENRRLLPLRSDAGR